MYYAFIIKFEGGIRWHSKFQKKNISTARFVFGKNSLTAWKSFATITVGYPDSIPAQVDRLPLEAAVHQETYHDYTSEDIDKLYAYKESLPENKQFIEENQKETLAQVFTDIRYTKKDNEFMSDNLLKVLRQQGFLK